MKQVEQRQQESAVQDRERGVRNWGRCQARARAAAVPGLTPSWEALREGEAA